MTADTQRWLATSADGREIAIEVRPAPVGGGWIPRVSEVDVAPWTQDTADNAVSVAVRDIAKKYAVREVRREGEPSRVQLLAAVAAARKELERILALGCDNSGTLVADEAAKAARTALAALPETQS